MRCLAMSQTGKLRNNGPLEVNGRCDQCGKPRNQGNHARCSERRRRANKGESCN